MGAFGSRDFHDCGTMSSYNCRTCPELGTVKETLLNFFMMAYSRKSSYLLQGDDLVYAPRSLAKVDRTCGDIHTCDCLETLLSNSVLSSVHDLSDTAVLNHCKALSIRIYKSKNSLLSFGEDTFSGVNTPFSKIDHSSLKSLTSKIFLCRTLDRYNLPRSFCSFRVYKSLASPTIYELHSSDCYLHTEEDDDVFISVEDAVNFMFYLEISNDAYRHSKGMVEVGVGLFPSRNGLLYQDRIFCSILKM